VEVQFLTFITSSLEVSNHNYATAVLPPRNRTPTPEFHTKVDADGIAADLNAVVNMKYPVISGFRRDVHEICALL
jgi:hypothetical protein